MGTFYILGASGRQYSPDEWIECQKRMEAYESKVKESNAKKAEPVKHGQTAGQNLFAGDPKA